MPLKESFINAKKFKSPFAFATHDFMLGRYKRKIAKRVAQRNKSRFEKRFDTRHLLAKNSSLVNVAVVSFSGVASFQDQLYCIASFVRNVGKPVQWTVYTDGSHTTRQLQQLNEIPFVQVKKVNVEGKCIAAYCLNEYPLLKKLIAFSEHPIEGTTLFCDSDVLFFPVFKTYLDAIKQRNWFLPDEDVNYFDEEYLAENHPRMFGINTGFMVLNDQPDWSIALHYVQQRIENKLAIGHWSEQTGIHKMVIESPDFNALDPRKFVLAGTDSFRISIHPDWQKIALRHFVGPIRHKMWQTNWQKVLK